MSAVGEYRIEVRSGGVVRLYQSRTDPYEKAEWFVEVTLDTVRDFRKVTDAILKPSKEASSAGRADRFDEFWKLYPKKVGKDAAVAVWKQRNLDAHADQILAALEVWKSSDGWKKGYIHNPVTWLRGGHWKLEDDTSADDGLGEVV